MSCALSMPESDDLAVMVDCLGEMRRDGIIPNVVWVSGLIEALCVSGRRDDFWKGDGPIPVWRLKELQKELGAGQWVARWGLYGPKRIVQAQFDEIKDVLERRAPTGTLTGALYTGKEEDGGLLEATDVPNQHGAMFVGVPSMWSLPLVNWTVPRAKQDFRAATPTTRPSSRRRAPWCSSGSKPASPSTRSTGSRSWATSSCSSAASSS